MTFRLLMGDHRRVVLGAACVAILIVGGAISVLLTGASSGNGSLSEDDLVAVEQVALTFRQAKSATCCVPASALAEVEERIAAAESGRAKSDGESADILPSETREAIDAAFSATVSETCTAAFASRLGRGTSYGEDLAEALRNNRRSAIYTDIEDEITSVQCKGMLGDDHVVWVQFWTMSAGVPGRLGESWPVVEFVMHEAAGEWRIAEYRLIWNCCDADERQWGPDSPHQDLGDGEPVGPSVLDPDAELSSSDF